MTERYFLAGDIGGTKTNLALYSLEDRFLTPLYEQTFKSRDFVGLEAVVNVFLSGKVQPFAACFGVAGPVFDGSVKVTKLDWHLSQKALEHNLSIPEVLLINDLTATGHSLPYLQENDYCVINKGKNSPQANKVIIAPGTGLGEAILTWNIASDCYDVMPSEGGHALFAPANEIHLEIIKYLYDNHAPITYDKICSGHGISLIHDFFKEKYPENQTEVLPGTDKLGHDKTPAIVERAITGYGTASNAVRAVEAFVEILASEAANAALRLLAGGGVYLAGGIPVRILKFFKDDNFMSVFTARPPFNDFLVQIPIKLVTNPKAALIGAAAYGIKKYG